jgi:hypothetical protein
LGGCRTEEEVLRTLAGAFGMTLYLLSYNAIQDIFADAFREIVEEDEITVLIEGCEVLERISLHKESFMKITNGRLEATHQKRF